MEWLPSEPVTRACPKCAEARLVAQTLSRPELLMTLSQELPHARLAKPSEPISATLCDRGIVTRLNGVAALTARLKSLSPSAEAKLEAKHPHGKSN